MPSQTIDGLQLHEGPYEVLIRFGEDFAIQGAHIVFQQALKDADGNTVHRIYGDAIPLALDNGVFDSRDPATVAPVDALKLGDFLVPLPTLVTQSAQMTVAQTKAEAGGFWSTIAKALGG